MREKKFCCYCGGPLETKILADIPRRYCKTCQIPIYENPVPATCLVVSNRRGRILLVRRAVAPCKGMWCLPGGFMEIRELAEAAALRELREETGLTGRIESLLGVTTSPNDSYGSVLLVGFLVQEFSGRANAGDDAQELGWFAEPDLPRIAFESHERFIRLYRAVGV